MAGFTSGEGCFSVGVLKANTTKLGETVRLRFQLTQHVRDEQLMKGLVTYLGCGTVRTRKGGLAVDYRVDKFLDLTAKIIPFFEKYPIIGVKAQDFRDFCKVVDLMKAKKHLTAGGLDQIKKIITGMNTGRKID
ncbi:MAG TPA: LAGLIDADG family homing endonuclease [Chitinophagaceae bacterium]